MVTWRDEQMLQFVQKMKVCRTTTLTDIFYTSYRVGARRLSILTKNEAIKRHRDGWTNQYIYYEKKPKQFRHALMLSDLYHAIWSNVDEIKKFIIEPKLGDIRPDAVIGFVSKKVDHIALIEIELSNKGFDYKKYAAFNWKKFFPVKPEIIIVSDRDIECKEFDTYFIGTDLDIEKSGLL